MMMATASRDGNGHKIIVAVTSVVVSALIIQALFALIWAAHMDAKISILETQQVNQDNRIAALDNNGSRRLAVIEDRQTHVLSIINDNSKRIDRLEALLIQHMKDNPSRGAQ